MRKIGVLLAPLPITPSSETFEQGFPRGEGVFTMGLGVKGARRWGSVRLSREQPSGNLTGFPRRKNAGLREAAQQAGNGPIGGAHPQDRTRQAEDEAEFAR